MFILCGASLFYQCANPKPLTGGDEDTTPPVMDTVKSTANLQTNFHKNDILLFFDEWIQLKNPLSQIIVSPPLDHTPSVRLKGKRVSFSFHEDEILKENVTYTVNFGDAIVDLTESNPTSNLKYVFSTGDKIDSLTVKGIVVDALTEDRVEGAGVMLYNNLSDTVVRTEKPYYYTKSDTIGRFTLSNIKEGKYKLFVLMDENLNYRYDLPVEKIGFTLAPIDLSSDSDTSYVIKIFGETSPLKRMDEKLGSHVASITFNRTPNDLDFRLEPNGGYQVPIIVDDTLKIWHFSRDTNLWKVYLQQDTFYYDTLELKSFAPGESVVQSSARIITQNRFNQPIVISPASDAVFQFSAPLLDVYTDSVFLLVDSLPLTDSLDVYIDSVDHRFINISYPWKSDKTYTVTLFPGAVTDGFGRINDTVNQLIFIPAAKNVGAIDLNISDMDSTEQYIIVLSKKESEPIFTKVVRGMKKYNKLLPGLGKPGNYHLSITIDRNKNGRWDSGKYQDRSMPEKIIRSKLEPLRANWELVVEQSVLK